ncbi:MAG: SDR family NAD(P)-dependent oxidoreductase [Nocardioidaceae bacterium]
MIAGSVILVTGASSGIGRATALRLADLGAHLVVHGADKDRLAALAEEAGAVPVRADLSEPAAMSALCDDALAAHGHIDAVVNNAGFGWAGSVTAMSAEQVRRLVAVDLVAPMELTRLLLPAMLGRGRGHFCFVGSIVARTGVRGEAVYAAAKSGLDGFAESLRYEVSNCGIRVSVVVPGAVDTPFFARRGSAYNRRVPSPRSPEQVADAVVRCLSDGRAEAYVPGWLRLPVALQAVAPKTFRALAARFGQPPTESPWNGA